MEYLNNADAAYVDPETAALNRLREFFYATIPSEPENPCDDERRDALASMAAQAAFLKESRIREAVIHGEDPAGLMQKRAVELATFAIKRQMSLDEREEYIPKITRIPLVMGNDWLGEQLTALLHAATEQELGQELPMPGGWLRSA